MGTDESPIDRPEVLIERFQAETVRELYRCPAAVVAVLRFLPALGQELLGRLAFVPSPVPRRLLNSWLAPAHETEAHALLARLRRLRILSEAGDSVTLSPEFQASLRAAQLGLLPRSSLSGLDAAEVEPKYAKSAPELGAYGAARWESLLEYLALPSSTSEREVSKDMKDMLALAGLTGRGDDGEDGTEITSAGFRFLLLERRGQLWRYLCAYLGQPKLSEAEAGASLAFLFRLAFTTPQRALASAGCDDMGDFIQHLRQLGLVNMRKRKDGWFYATPAVHLLLDDQIPTLKAGPDAKDETTRGQSGGRFLVVETNYRVYAYTSSVLQLAILSTFADLNYRFENMAVALLSRESVRRAFQVGISSAEILAYLGAHSLGPELRAAKLRYAEAGALAFAKSVVGGVPPSVSDQVRLWELERDRFTFTPVSMYSGFESEGDFQRLKAFATEKRLLEWASAESRTLLLNAEGHDEVKQFWKHTKSA